MRRENGSERWKELFYVAQKVDYVFRALDQLVVFSGRERCIYNVDITVGSFAQGVRVDFGFQLCAYGKKVLRLDTPEGLQVCVDLVILIGQLNSIFANIVPPLNNVGSRILSG